MSWRTAANAGWLDSLKGVERDHPLAKHTSFNIGGAAEWFLETADVELMQEVVAACAEREIPCRVLGAGTNLLIADAGVEGLVVRCVARRHRVDGNCLEAEAGLKMMRLARIAAEANLTGFEFAIGVPGSVGGAVYQNAGCWGKEIRSVLVSVRVFSPSRGVEVLPVHQLELGYRTSAFREGRLRDALIVSAVIRLEPGDGAASRRLMSELTSERERTQPIKTKNCGSVFKNPPGDSAGRLVEAAGFKGAREGAAQISEQHANFIVNQGGAIAVDVARLIDRVRATVEERFGVVLEPEVERIGRWEPAA